MKTYDEALQCILANALLQPLTQCNINQALGFVCAKNVKSPEQLPNFSNSAMDGFAVNTLDLKTASETHPVFLNVNGTIAAGEGVIEREYTPNGVWEIMTGALIPKWADAVIKLEDVRIMEVINEIPKKILVKTKVTPGLNIRYPGEDFEENTLVLAKGCKIAPEHILACSALGLNTLSVYKKPTISIISTGNEIEEEGKLAPGKIRNANQPYLNALITMAGLTPCLSGLVKDEVKGFLRQLDKIIQKDNPDIIISTGAVSQGRWDFIPKALDKTGATIFFHKVKIRPGKPILFARLKNGSYYFGLPGNPSAVAVGWRFFVHPLLLSMQGLSHEQPLKAKVINREKHRLKKDFVSFLKGKYYYGEDNQLLVEVLEGQEAFKIRPLLEANCWVKGESQSEFAPDFVSIYSLRD
ncbi:MAG TPA: molybdopterin molybdotransferase MoeA [Gammaproteobacteria bacterium]|nr:molybdopterin molybdotransferase MoeA [Gammaproteobacteria bacterium]